MDRRTLKMGLGNWVEGDRYRFVSKLLRDWWKARHGFGYIPTSKRGV